MSAMSIVITSLILLFFMFFTWLCILSIRLSIAYKIIVTLYKNDTIETTEKEVSGVYEASATATPIVPPFSLENKEHNNHTQINTYMKAI